MSDEKRTYVSLLEVGNDLYANDQSIVLVDKLLPASYTLNIKKSMFGNQIYFTRFNVTSDNILDLPSPEYQKVISEMNHFLLPETKTKFVDKGFLYKRSALLWGAAGTGKSIIVSRVIRDVINSGGVCLFVDNPSLLKDTYSILNDLQRDTLVLVVFEEIDGLIESYGDSEFLSILDGEIQKENIMYLATTNFINKIPKRLLRPGRFSSTIEVKYPTTEARKMYFETKMGKDFKSIKTWVEKSKGLSVDDLKEIVQSVYIFNNDLDDTIERLVSTKGINASRSKIADVLDQLEEDEEDNSQKEMW